MFRLNGKATLPRKAEEVTSFLADVSNEAKWQKDMVHVALVGGAKGTVGAKYERVQLVGGRNIKTVNELTELVPGKRLVYKAAGKVIEYQLTYALAGKGDATDLEMTLEGEMLGFASMFEGIAADELRAAIPANLERLKKALAR